MHVTIIGAGVSGLMSAYYLLQRNIRVSVVESSPKVATKASGANAAQLSWTYVNPIGSPGLIGKIIPILRGKVPGFKLKNYSKDSLAFALRLLGQCSSAKFNANREELLDLSMQSKGLFQTMLDDMEIDCQYEKLGKMHLYTDSQMFESHKQFSQSLVERGIRQDILSAQECVNIAPKFCDHISLIAGGIYAPDDSIAECQQFCEQLVAMLQEAYPHFDIQYDSKVTGVERKKRRVTALHTSHESFDSDVFLLCTGSATNRLLKILKAPPTLVYPVKGYSLDIPCANPRQILPFSITDSSLKMVFVPMDEHIRVSGCFHIDGYGRDIDQEAIEYMKQSIAARYPDLDLSNMIIKTGLRPCTPSSTPIISRYKYRNLYLNTGQGMLGWTLAHASAYRTAKLIADEHDS